MAAAKAAIGTFQYADLRHFQNLTVVSASERSFCLQVVKGGKLFHLRGPGGRPAEGAC
jgi:hypothetical protein